MSLNFDLGPCSQNAEFFKRLLVSVVKNVSEKKHKHAVVDLLTMISTRCIPNCSQVAYLQPMESPL